MNSPILSKRFKIFLLLILAGGINSILNTLVIVTTRLATGEEIEFVYPLLWETTGAYSFMILVPIMLYLFRRLPLKKENLLQRIPIYIFVTLILGAVHTVVMYYSRIWLYQLLDWGKYDYGYLPYRYVMETLKLFIGFWSVWAIYTLIKTNKERQQDKLRAVQLEEELVKTRLEFLKSQLNPHFLFNTLNMISSTMYENVEDADKMIANLSDLLRISLKTSNGVHTLKEEFDLLNLYLEIMRARFHDRLITQIDIDATLFNNLVPTFLLQPIVENSIKYGMENLSVTEIKVAAKLNVDKILLTVADNGPGIHLTTEEVLKHGVGLSNTQERLERIYRNNFEFSWENLNDGGLRVNINIPVNG